MKVICSLNRFIRQTLCESFNRPEDMAVSGGSEMLGKDERDVLYLKTFL